jgi:hypothetical protein
MLKEVKFEIDDLPKILAALHQARQSNAKATVKVEFDACGGVIAIDLETKRKIK